MEEGSWQFTGIEIDTYVGMDVTAISRVQRLLEEYPDRFREFAFTRDEQRYCDGKPYRAQHYAARWAAKEAFIKSVRGFDSSPDLRSIEIDGDSSPGVSLRAEGTEMLRPLTGDGSREVTTSVSLGHERRLDLAFATVVVVVR